MSRARFDWPCRLVSADDVIPGDVLCGLDSGEWSTCWIVVGTEADDSLMLRPTNVDARPRRVLWLLCAVGSPFGGQQLVRYATGGSVVGHVLRVLT